MTALRLLTTLLVIVITSALNIAAQAPVACSCVLVYDDSPQSHPLIGSATTYASCTVNHPTPTTPRCEVSGTIELNYNIPDDTWELIHASWADPLTYFTPVSGLQELTHPAGTDVACGGSPSTVGSSLLIIWREVANPTNQIALSLVRRWSCDLD